MMRVVAVVGVVGLAMVEGGIISSSTLQMCEKREDGENVDTTCEEKMVIAMDLQNQQQETDSIRAVPSATCDADGENCEDGDEQNLVKPIIVTASKSRVRLRYPVTYSHMTFNDNPYEIFLCGPGGDDYAPDDGSRPDICSQLPATFGVGPFTSNPCVDGSAEPEPSCGWRFPSSYSTSGTTWADRRENKLDDSQGFCCECELGDFLGTGESQESRAGLLCDALDTGSAHATAHCMRLKNLWYDAYNVEAAEAHFNIDVRFRQCEDEACVEFEDTVLTVGPHNIEARDPVTDSSVKFIGEFGPTQDNPSFEHQYLLRPLCLDTSDPECAAKQSAEREHTSRWLLLDKNRFSLSGLDCSQIGVGYSAFRNQPERCEQKLGSCLDGIYSNGVLLSSAKIKDYYEEDLDRERNSQTPLYFVGSQMASSDFVMSPELASRTSWGGGATFLEWEIDRFQSSLIQVVLKAGFLSYERNIASGRITDHEIPPFETGQEGRVRVHVENTGSSLAGQFSVSINTCTNGTSDRTCTQNSDCGGGIRCTDRSAGDCDPGEVCVCNVIGAYLDPFQAKPTRTLGPGETDDLTFAVRASVALGASYCCNVTMKSAYEVADRYRFCFETTDQIRNFIGGDACDPAKEDCEGMAGMGGDACAAYCKSYDVACQFDNADVCMPGLFWIAIWIVIIILVGCVVQRLGLCYPVCKMFGCAKCAFKHCRGNKK